MKTLSEDRRALHRIPETGCRLPETAAYLRGALAEMPCTLLAPWEDAVCAYFDLGKDETVAVRSDMDALPVTERTGLPFASTHPGRMHACGHDGHMAIALGCIRLLAPLRTHLRRNIRFLFQPAEEGVRGAASLTGQVRGFPYFLGYHIGLSCRETGAFVAGVSGSFATTKFNLCFTGKEAHAAQSPEDGCDALKGACETVLALHALPRHSAGPGRVNVGVMTAGTGRNIVPGSARLECEVRGRPEEVSDFLFAGARRAAEGAALMNGLGLRVETVGHAGCMESDDALSSRMAALAEDFRIDGRPGFTRVIQKARGSASEDAATLMQAVQMGGGQASYMLFGSQLASGHHSGEFDFDESILAPASRFLALAAMGLAGQE